MKKHLAHTVVREAKSSSNRFDELLGGKEEECFLLNSFYLRRFKPAV